MKIVPVNRQAGAPSQLRQALKSSGRAFFFVAIFSFFINLLMLTSPIYMLQVYDRVLTARSESTLIYLSLIIAAMMLVMAMLEMVRSRVLVRVSGKMDQMLSGKVFDAIFALNLRSPAANRSQSLRDLDMLRQFITSQGPFALFDAPWAPIFIGIVFMMHPLLGLVATIGAVILFALAYVTEVTTKKPLNEANVHAIKAASFAEASLKNSEVLAAMGMLPGIRRRWRVSQDKALMLQAQASDAAGGISALTKFIRLLLQSSMLGFGAYLALEGQITAGVMIAASIIMGRGLAPVEQAIGSWKSFVSARGAYQRLDDLLRTFNQQTDTMELPAPVGHVAVDRVVAMPPGANTPTIKGISFALTAGEALAIIGPSAAGKSTLARLLVGIWAPHSGSVRLDGADVYSWNHEQLGPHIGYLPQDVEIFDGTIKENIARFGEVDATKVVEAAQLAGVHELILRLPSGYDTLIGPGGIALSGGQRQRLGLARAVYGNPSFIVLDEPNSNLDSDGEVALVNGLQRLKQMNATVILISHRPSILNHVDKVLLLREGMVEMFGPKQDVIARLTRPVAQQAAVPPQGGAAPGQVTGTTGG
ncbi:MULTISPECIES: type I secretion system permease/ATPase [unclassified Azospirillum]|uniref:type I secretion system permease/ATPase n=1 Tax=unclassified Azospirillum TaxID=2630922 RepID=UPI000B746741|nr:MULTISPECIES: type I secretion system permease/ATPase [unclassified Azospirillum]SNS69055.1 ATP-binding cassette, subfamily C, exporter for protease/lipase/ATP-binding cassette, subfamily C, EexD [Azospirillum sp. RU38E]SNS87161.1 ATP-binding cassette, subfamily C, exporter for protease/lipase/ATP-binding cassette, subfamily C, EexD [Azospirillum sp. RU37A]